MSIEPSSGNYFRSTSASFPTPRTSAWTAVIWARYDGGGSGYRCALAYGSNAAGNAIECGINGSGIWYVHDGDQQRADGGGSPTTNAWHQIALVKASTAAPYAFSLYIDGTSEVTGWVDASVSAADHVVIGTEPNADIPWEGQLTGFQFYDGVALSAAELNAQALQMWPARLDSLISWCRALTDTDTVDYSGTGTDFTETGSVTTSSEAPAINWRRGGTGQLIVTAGGGGGGLSIPVAMNHYRQMRA